MRYLTIFLLIMLAVLPGTWMTSAQGTFTLTGTTRQLTTDGAGQLDPAISGDVVVYSDQRNGNDDIYFVNAVTGVETQVTTATTAQRLNDVSGTRIVYTDLTPPGRRVTLYDVTTGATSVVGSGILDQNPRIEGNIVVFERGLGSAADVYAVNLATNTETTVAATSATEINPAVSGTRVAYERHSLPVGPGDIVLFDLVTGTETVLAGTDDERRPDIDGNFVVWDLITPGGDTDIAVHNLSTGATQVLARPGNQRSPHVSGDFVCFDDDAAGNQDVMLYHIPTGTFHPIAIEAGVAEFLNNISGKRIVYTCNQAGNNDIWLFDFNHAPAAVCQNVTRAAGANCQAVVTAEEVGGASSDPDGDAVTLALNPAGPFTLGTHSVTLTVSDAYGGSASCNATVTVVDNTPPSINCPANPVADTALGQCAAVVNYSVTATDNCSAAVVICTPPSGSSFGAGTTAVSCVATDQAGNQANCSFNVTVNDTQPPSIICPANIIVTSAAGASSAIINYPAVMVFENCSAGAPVCTPPAGSSFPLGATTVNCSVTDGAGNTGQCFFMVTVNAAPTPNDKIVFESSRDGNLEIYVMQADGTGQTRLTSHTALDFNPAWSPDRSKVAFTSGRTGNGDIYVMNADGTNVTRLTSNSAIEDDASWSPDGTKIAFWSSRDSNPEIYVMQADGTGQTRLTSHARSDTQPSWSPDGAKLLFVSNRSGLVNFDIYVMRADGSQVTRLTTNLSIDESPDWSPDGTKIAFTSNRSNLLDFEIWVMNVDGNGQTRLTTSARSNVRPSWSADGARITFATNRHSLLNFEIYTMNANGSNQTRLTTNSAVDSNPD